MKHRRAQAGAGLLLAAVSTAGWAHPPQHAYPASDRLGLVLEGNLEFGGDDVATIVFDDGSSEDVKAGDGVTVAGGLHFQPAHSPLDLRATVGYKFVRTEDGDSDLGMNRVVWELAGTLDLGQKFWIGGGLTHHSNIEFDADGLDRDLEFDDATGYTLEAGWSFIALTYTDLEYTDEFGNDYDASNVGVSFIGRF